MNMTVKQRVTLNLKQHGINCAVHEASNIS